MAPDTSTPFRLVSAFVHIRRLVLGNGQSAVSPGLSVGKPQCIKTNLNDQMLVGKHLTRSPQSICACSIRQIWNRHLDWKHLDIISFFDNFELSWLSFVETKKLSTTSRQYSLRIAQISSGDSNRWHLSPGLRKLWPMWLRGCQKSYNSQFASLLPGNISRKIVATTALHCLWHIFNS